MKSINQVVLIARQMTKVNFLSCRLLRFEEYKNYKTILDKL